MYNSHAWTHQIGNRLPAFANKFGVFIYDHKSSQPIGNGLNTRIRFVLIKAVITTNKNSEVYKFISLSIIIDFEKKDLYKSKIFLYQSARKIEIIIKKTYRLYKPKNHIV